MPGRMGGEMVSIKNLEIVKIDLENHLLYVEVLYLVEEMLWL